MSSLTVISISILYLLLLFGLAYWSEYRAKLGKSLLRNPFIYALSLSVYCTAWTYYGSVGRASQDGLLFLTIYIGPILGMMAWWWIMTKIVRICKLQRITTLADATARVSH
jgi:Na+/proline symporter